MVADTQPHLPVMAGETLRYLRILPDGVYLDATTGAGGHATRIAQCLSGGRLIGLDRDPIAVALAADRLRVYPGVVVVKANYCEAPEVLARYGVERVSGVLLDAGVSSMQLDAPERGFSLQADGPLDMRMDPTQGKDAATWLAESTFEEIRDVLRNFGDVGPAGRIARVITARCRENRMRRTSDFVSAIRDALDFGVPNPDEIRTCFMAVRIAVNEELNFLEQGLRCMAQLLAVEGRLVVITFHSGEDRVAKRVFRELTRPTIRLYPDGRVRERTAPAFRLVVPGPVTPTPSEIRANSRARGARMRVIERVVAD